MLENALLNKRFCCPADCYLLGAPATVGSSSGTKVSTISAPKIIVNASTAMTPRPPTYFRLINAHTIL